MQSEVHPTSLLSQRETRSIIVQFHMGLQFSMRNEIYPTSSLSQRETRSILYGSTWFATFHAKRGLPHTASKSVRGLWFLALHGKLQTYVELYNNRPRFALTQRWCQVDFISHGKLQTHVESYNIDLVSR